MFKPGMLVALVTHGRYIAAIVKVATVTKSKVTLEPIPDGLFPGFGDAPYDQYDTFKTKDGTTSGNAKWHWKHIEPLTDDTLLALRRERLADERYFKRYGHHRYTGSVYDPHGLLEQQTVGKRRRFVQMELLPQP